LFKAKIPSLVLLNLLIIHVLFSLSRITRSACQVFIVPRWPVSQRGGGEHVTTLLAE
jgi:hypothetical protein